MTKDTPDDYVKRIRAMRAKRRQRYLDSVGGKPWTVVMTASNKPIDTVIPIRCEDSNGPVAFVTFKEADAWCEWMRRQWLGSAAYEVRRV
jgi:hypothetical protein